MNLRPLIFLLTLSIVGCGPSEEEVAAQQAANREAAKQAALDRSYYLSLIENCNDTAMNTQIRLESCVEAHQIHPDDAFSLGGFGLKQLPDDFFIGFEHLTSLDLTGNQFTELPSSFSRLQQLKYISISDNPISQLPEAMYGFKQLETVFAGITDIREISPKINQLTNLAYLNLYSTPLESLPSLAGLTGLRQLVIAKTLISRLPQGGLEAPELKILDMSNLDYLADDDPLPGIERLQSLVMLDIGENQLETLPSAVASLPNLRFLVLRSNPLKDLPVELLEHPQLGDRTPVDPYFLAIEDYSADYNTYSFAWIHDTNGVEMSYTQFEPNNSDYCQLNLFVNLHPNNAGDSVNIKDLPLCNKTPDQAQLPLKD